MKNRVVILIALFFSNFPFLFAQQNKTTEAFKLLDNSFFKWKEFSFAQPWSKLKSVCDFEKIESFPEKYNEYLEYFVGSVRSDNFPQEKSYTLRNTEYQEFNGLKYEQVILHLYGINYFEHSRSSLSFIKQLNDNNGEQTYREILKTFKLKYGNTRTEESLIFFKTLSQESYEHTIWSNHNNIEMTLYFVKKCNLIIFQVTKMPTKGLNLLTESEYDENFTDAFKDLDAAHVFRGIKFGADISEIRQKTSLKPDAYNKKFYECGNKYYYTWKGYIFDNSSFHFNYLNKFDFVSLFQENKSVDDFNLFVSELQNSFGSYTLNGEKYVWKGKKVMIVTIYHSDSRIMDLAIYSLLVKDKNEVDD